jgi:hypothetical protein
LRETLNGTECLAPGASYPPRTHAGHEELHLLGGELWIEVGRTEPAPASTLTGGRPFLPASVSSI